MTSDLPRRRILVVDDLEVSAMVVARLLATLGQDVETAHDGLSALEKFQQQPFDVVFSDLVMPRMDGYQLAQSIRKLHGRNGTILVALSGHSEPDDVTRAREAGFDRHLVKPVSIQALIEILQ